MAQQPEERSSPSPSSSGDDAEDDSTMVKTEDSKAPRDQSASSQNTEQKKPVSSAKNKDPSRPKRKKARRACFACQRAHLTCGDERPCQRCVKRGLTDSCQDGARKKAKYLHDTPAEALIPGNIVNFPHLMKQNHTQPPSRAGPENGLSSQQYVGQAPSFNPSFQQPARPPSMPDNSYPQYANSNQSPISSQYSASHQTSPVSGVPSGALPQHASNPPNAQSLNQAQLYDNNDTSMFNFDLASMNFGNHYGAMEFGMLGHLAGGSNDPILASARPPSSSTGGFDEYGQTFNESKPEFTFNGQDPSWSSGQPTILQQQYPHLTGEDRRSSHIGPHAFAIGAGPGSLSAASPSSADAEILGYDQNGNAFQGPQQLYTNMEALGHGPSQLGAGGQTPQHPPQAQERARHRKVPSEQIALSGERGAQVSESISNKLIELNAILPPASKTRRNTTSIYSSITKPYPYTAAFHALTAVLRRRFPHQKRLKIAQALATVRPSFISCTRTLVLEDLIFMEKCFQRGLFDYDNFQHDVCTPTIVCRRTGEVAHVTKEFCIMSGWNRDVLLGRKPNRNANISVAESNSATSTKGQTTPNHEQRKGPRSSDGPDADDAARQQPVFLAELLDEDSVVKFYEDYAKLAFADHKGSISSKCQVVKYMTKDEMASRKSRSIESANGDHNSRGIGISGENAMRTLGAKEGRVNCVFCWEVKRDVFNIPMFIVLNFLPIT